MRWTLLRYCSGQLNRVGACWIATDKIKPVLRRRPVMTGCLSVGLPSSFFFPSFPLSPPTSLLIWGSNIIRTRCLRSGTRSKRKRFPSRTPCVLSTGRLDRSDPRDTAGTRSPQRRLHLGQSLDRDLSKTAPCAPDGWRRTTRHGYRSRKGRAGS